MSDPAPAGEDRRALYLRWRPRTFADVVGQEAATRTLRNAVVRGTVAHAYLLCGPRGTGKTSLARILYKALNCEQAQAGDPCGRCASCLAADAGRAIDLIEIDAASNRGIDDIRDLRERVRFAPAEAEWKLYIVDEAHQLTAAAWDAFLKTLEEPPPPTIVSRCQRFDLTRFPQPLIAQHLTSVAEQEGITLQTGVADRLARLAHGGMRDALGMLEQVASFAGSPVTVEAARRVLGLARGDAMRAFVDAVSARDAAAAFSVLEELVQEGADLRQFLGEVLFDLRGALLARVGAESAIAADFGPDESEWLRSVGQRWAPASLAAALKEFAELDAPGLDERQFLIRLELAVATVAGLTRDDAVVREPARSPHSRPLEPDAPEEAAPVPMPSPARSAREAPTAPVADATAELPHQGPDPEPPAIDPPAAPAPMPSVAAPSLAAVQGRWQSVVDGYVGNLLDKLLLARVHPAALGGGVLTLGGRLDALELRQIESCRKTLESRLGEEFGTVLRVRFEGDAGPPADSALPAAEGGVDRVGEDDEPNWAEAPLDDDRLLSDESALSLVETAARMFGGEIVPDLPEAGSASTASAVPYDDHGP
jgi:DNA polymerase-3 subunit gamma/tau